MVISVIYTNKKIKEDQIQSIKQYHFECLDDVKIGDMLTSPNYKTQMQVVELNPKNKFHKLTLLVISKINEIPNLYINIDEIYIKENNIDLPIEIVKHIALENIRQHGMLTNVFKRNEFNLCFAWTFTKEGHCFWSEILDHKKFDIFYKKYPKINTKINNNVNKMLLL